MTRFTREYGQVVRLLDSEKLLALGLEVLTAQYGDLDPIARVEPLILVETTEASVWWDSPERDRRLAVVCHEGVGWQEDKETGLVPFFVDFGVHGSHALKVQVHPRRIKACLSDETIDLADFIRNYNDRTETNYHIWKSQIGSTPQFAQEVNA